MSSIPGQVPFEEKKPNFLRRPVPIWAFLLLVVLLVILLFLPGPPLPLPPSIQQPLILTPDNRPITINPGETTTITANFTVANVNQTNTIPATATATLLFPNSTAVPAKDNITVTIYGVQTRSSFIASSDGKGVSFPPGGNILIVRVVPAAMALPGSYIVTVALAD